MNTGRALSFACRGVETVYKYEERDQSQKAYNLVHEISETQI